MVFVLVALAVLALLAAVHRYVWRRFVGDTTARGSAMRGAGTAAAFVLPLLSVGALVSGRVGAPFWLQQVLAWPGYLWLAALLYLTLALLVGEAVRPVLRRALARRDRGATAEKSDEESAERNAEENTFPRTGALALAGAPADSPAPPADGRPEHEPPQATATPEGVEPPEEAEPPQAAAPPATGPSRRLFVARAVGGAAAVAGLGTVGYGTYGVLRGPRTKRITVPLAKLPRSAHGYRIAVVSDVHLGPILGRAHTMRIVDAVNATRPDLVAVVGDLVDGSVADLGTAAEPLARLEARHGSYFVTGNHEYFSGAAQWVDHVRELGLHPLENARVEFDGFDLAGVNDIAGESEGQGPDFVRALGDRDRARAAVLLAHQPVVIHDAVEHGVDLQLSGHTHGGQLWPGSLIAGLANPTVAGLERYGDTQLYVSRGAGAWGPPVRVGAASDITVVELASRQA
ncbi:metallophosphoesterase [Streptomyces sp. NBC_01433]|uniref:metallophosphoesterase n=1 Tax=Streptomyces sp. NBC_01433 TaxID=2903864 RepID=UPI00225ACD15|nr:metallophosphoesterase [Streptomyces sp. NBC_01433]MCX4674765.1 metallophosphoesterase [Streptomyces sp. NBC_01433]